ncbi:porin [Mesorhizobium sp. CAU 1732]|uniref:porin n=1 Tax=Mesorhizobium sp. CAU 1732 TaxID=3140358 RepID=UPI0032611465
MNIKSLLLGSAAALVAATGARAADAIVIAEPEPMEYVRICDMYGAGFFYIPGTENCLKIGGYIRYEMRYSDWGAAEDGGDRFTKFARFAPTFDVRNETEWGTLRGFAELRINWASGFGGSTTAIQLNHAFIELQQAMGTFRIGKGDTPYSRFLGYGSPFGPFDADYGFRNSGEVSYTFNGGNGFSAVVAAVEIDYTDQFEVGVEGGVNFTQGWGNVGAMVGYDTFADEFGAKLAVNGNLGIVALGGQVFYSSGAGSWYRVGKDALFANDSEFSALVYAKANVTEKLAIAGAFQWYDTEYNAGADGSWEVTAGLDWRPVTGLRIRPEIQYGKVDFVGGGDDDRIRSTIRFDRSF